MGETAEQNSVMASETSVEPVMQSKSPSSSSPVSSRPQPRPKCVIKGRDMPDEMANTAIEVTVNVCTPSSTPVLR